MYHLLNGNRKPPVSQDTMNQVENNREPVLEPNITELEPPAEPEGEEESVYTVIGAPVLPNEETEATTIVLDLHPARISSQTDEAPEPNEGRWNTSPVPHHYRFVPLAWMLAGVALVLVWVLIVTLVIPWWQTSATVTIVPWTQPVSVTVTVRFVPGNAYLARRQVQGRQLATITMSQSKTVPTTGSGYQPAQAAQGWITLYNALPIPQTISAGTLIIGQDGIQVATDSTVTLPAANAPIEGQASVSAHATEPGPAGNIAALDINGSCCRANITAKNSAAFTGGQNIRSFQAVSAQDITGASAALEASLMQDVTAAYQAELANGESLLTPVSCQAQVNADHRQGSEAKQVTITVSETCQGIAYNTVQMQALVTQTMNQESQAVAYQLDSLSLHMQITLSSSHREDLQVQATGTLVYRWSQQQQNALASLIAGKSKTQATDLLLQQPGIATVALSVSGRDTGALPGDADRIRISIMIPSCCNGNQRLK